MTGMPPKPVARAVIAATILVAACDPTGPDLRAHLRHQLEVNQQMWTENGSADYVMRIERNCTCTNLYDVRLSIEDGVVVAGESAFSGNPLTPAELMEMVDLEDLFELVQEALDERVANVSIQYSEEYGYVRHLYIDYDGSVVEDDVEFTVTEYTPAAAS